MARSRLREFFAKIVFPFVALWLLTKALWFGMGLLGIRRRPPRAGEIMFPALLRVVDRPRACIVASLDELRQNPLRVGVSHKVVLIDAAGQLYTLTNMYQQQSDLRTLWRLVAPNSQPVPYRFDLRRRRSGLAAAKAAAHGLANPAAIDAAETVGQLMSEVAGSAMLAGDED